MVSMVGITKQQARAIFVVMLFGGSALAYAVSMAFPGGEQTGVEGRAFVEIGICGEEKEVTQSSKEFDFGEIRVHEDNTVTFPIESGASLGHVFDTMDKSFSRNELMGYENNNMCNTTWANSVSVSRGRFLEGREDQPMESINQYREYELKHGDYISVRYD